MRRPALTIQWCRGGIPGAARRLDTDDDRFRNRLITAFRHTPNRHQHIRFGVIGRRAPFRYLIGNRLEALRAARFPFEVADQIHPLILFESRAGSYRPSS